MSHEEVVKHMKTHFMAEIEDFNGYVQMAENAEKMDKTEMAYWLNQMAKDEYTHAYYIKKVLEENDAKLTDEEMKKWHEMEEKVHHIFRE